MTAAVPAYTGSDDAPSCGRRPRTRRRPGPGPRWRVERPPTPASAAPTCTSSTATWTPGSARPAVIGHEMSGRDRRARRRASRAGAVGDPVTVMPLRLGGTCPACRPATATSARTSTSSASTPPARCSSAGPCPPRRSSGCPTRLPLDQAALVEPTAVAVHDVAPAPALRPGEQAVVVGGGPVGVLIALVARARRRRRPRPGARARTAAPLAERPRPGRLGPRGRRRRRAGRATGPAAPAPTWRSRSPAPRPACTTAVDALAVARPAGPGRHPPQPREVDLHRVFWRELTLLGARVYDRADFENAVALVADGVDPGRPADHARSCRWTEAPQAFAGPGSRRRRHEDPASTAGEAGSEPMNLPST